MNLPNKVENVLADYMNVLNEHLPGVLEGLYVHGSIALGAYVDGTSDIDFITITNRTLTENDSEALLKVHRTMEKNYEKPELDGVYIQWKDMGKLYRSKSDLKEDYPYYNDGKLQFGPYFNFNPVTWWTLKHGGVSLLGKEASSFDYGVTEQDLHSYVLQNMNSYWAERIQTVEESVDVLITLPSAQIDEEIEWTVLGLLRQFYTLKEKGIISKLGAGEYGLEVLPDMWHPIIMEAIHIRNSVKDKRYESEVERIYDVIRFSKYLIAECN